MEAALETIRTLATTDELTRVANRRHMNQVLEDMEARAAQDGPISQSTCLALLDIDHFKQINDRHGHAAGDAVLRGFAQVLRAGLRGGETLARWGGEEFLLLLPATGEQQALDLLERLRADVARLALPGLPGLRVTFSGGVSLRHGAEAFADTIGRADKALYRAKSSGRDRVLVG